MKRGDFLKLAGLGLIGALISPKLFSEDESNFLDDITLRKMLSEGKEVKHQNIKLYTTLDLSEYTTSCIEYNYFTVIGNQGAVNIPYDFKGSFSYNVIEHKKQFIF